jgi:hypothetical protein
VTTFKERTEPYRVLRYNGFPSFDIDGDTARVQWPGQSLSANHLTWSASWPPSCPLSRQRHRGPDPHCGLEGADCQAHMLTSMEAYRPLFRKRRPCCQPTSGHRKGASLRSGASGIDRRR